MLRLLIRSLVAPAAVAAAVASAAPALAAQGPAGGDSGTDIVPVALWSIVGVGIFALTLGILYLLKRRVGGFPRNPAWVAPISIMASKDLPGDVDAHDSDAGHGNDGHGDAPGGHAGHAAAAHH